MPRISSLAALNTPASDDVLAIVDTSDTVTKKITRRDLVESLYPVGSVYINASNSSNPSVLLGFGTWTATGQGRVLIGVNGSDSDFNTSGKTGGEKKVTLTQGQLPSHTHGSGSLVTNTTGAHSHGFTLGSENASSGVVPRTGTNFINNGATVSAGNHSHTISGSTSSTGSNEAHNNLQPYLTVYMWTRTT